MATQSLQKLNREVQGLKSEFADVRVLLCALLAEDKEGAYKPSFVKEVKKSMTDQPSFIYKGKGSLFAHLQKK